jgi:hypothetical protein
MPVLDPAHDLAHPVGEDPAWSESYYFNGYAPNADTGFFARVAVRPNEGRIDGFVWAWLPDGGVAQLRFQRAQDEMIDRVLQVGGVRIEMLDAGRRWRLVAAGEIADGRSCSLDATFDALMPMIGVDGASTSASTDAVRAAARASVAAGHLEQAGRWTGSFHIDGDVFPVDGARGNRDKSWGARRSDGSGGLRMWRWFSINFGDELHFGGVRIGTTAGELHRGWVWTGGEAASVRRWDLTTQVAEDDVRHLALDLCVHDKHDRVHELHGDVLRVERLGVEQANGVVVNEGLTRWESAAGIGYGVSEYAHVLGADGRPLVAVE